MFDELTGEQLFSKLSEMTGKRGSTVGIVTHVRRIVWSTNYCRKSIEQDIRTKWLTPTWPFIPLRSLNRVPALAVFKVGTRRSLSEWGREGAGNITLCDIHMTFEFL